MLQIIQKVVLPKLLMPYFQGNKDRILKKYVKQFSFWVQFQRGKIQDKQIKFRAISLSQYVKNVLAFFQDCILEIRTDINLILIF